MGSQSEHAAMLLTGMPLKHAKEHRPFNYFDEDSGKGHIRSPYAFTGSYTKDQVVIERGTSPALDSYMCAHPNALYFPVVQPSLPYWIYYTGLSSSS